MPACRSLISSIKKHLVVWWCHLVAVAKADQGTLAHPNAQTQTSLSSCRISWQHYLIFPRRSDSVYQLPPSWSGQVCSNQSAPMDHAMLMVKDSDLGPDVLLSSLRNVTIKCQNNTSLFEKRKEQVAWKAVYISQSKHRLRRLQSNWL